jgi:large subunit ribosomal protein L19
MNLIDTVNADHVSSKAAELPKFRTGDTVSVSYKITEGDKSRVQVYQGICIAMKEAGTLNGHFRVRKMSNGMGVERVFPFHCPNVEKVDVISHGKSRRAKHFYLRERTGKKARIAVDYDRKS